MLLLHHFSGAAWAIDSGGGNSIVNSSNNGSNNSGDGDAYADGDGDSDGDGDGGVWGCWWNASLS